MNHLMFFVNQFATYYLFWVSGEFLEFYNNKIPLIKSERTAAVIPKMERPISNPNEVILVSALRTIPEIMS